MKTIRLSIYGLAAILLVGLTMPVFAQNNIVTAKHADIINATSRQIEKDTDIRRMVSSFMSGNSMAWSVGLRRDDLREGIGVSQEHIQKIQEGIHNFHTDLQKDPKYKLLQEEERRAWGSFQDAVMADVASDVLEEIKQKYIDLKVKMGEMQNEKEANLFNEILTPDQMRKIQEFYISSMSESAQFVFPRMFEALDLSDEQRNQLDEIKKEMEPEFEKHADMQAEFTEKHHERLNELAPETYRAVSDPEERERRFQEVQKQVWAELQPDADEIMEFGKGLAKQLKFKMFDVLTDEQMERMADLIDNPPDYVKKLFPKRWKNDGGEWKPNANSWKPGDGIPEEYLQHREEQKARFPRKR